MKIRSLALTCAMTFLATAVPNAAVAEPPLDRGADLVALSLDGDALTVEVRDADGERHRPEDLVLTAEAGAVPERGDLAFLGEPGSRVWTVGADAWHRFPSWDATGIPGGTLVDETVRLRLAAVDGPGRVHAYTLEAPGVAELRLGTGGNAPDELPLRAGTELGGSVWAFDAPGRYTLTVEAHGELRSGGPVSSSSTYTVDVPTEDAPPADAENSVPGLRAVAVRAAAEDTADRKVFTDGHLDMGPRFVDGEWRVQIRDDATAPPTWRALSDVVVHAVDKSKIKVPDDPAYAFLGAPGADVWLLPQAQQSGIVWPGWNTQDPSVVEKVTGDVTWSLDEVDGPGSFSLFLTGSFGKPEVLFDAAKPLPQSLPVPVNTHAHGNWGFTKPGVYHLTVTFKATAGGAEVTDTRVLNIAVGDATDPNGAFGPGEDGDGDEDGLSLTGSPWFVPTVAAGAAILVAGVVLLVMARRRKRVGA